MSARKNPYRPIRCTEGAPETYLWIGNATDGPAPSWCYATLSNKRDIRRLRDWLNVMLGEVSQ